MEMGAYQGFFQTNCGLWIPLTVLIFLTIGYWGLPLIVWALATLAVLYFWGAPCAVIIAAAVIFAIFVIKPIRTVTASKVVMTLLKKLGFLPKISETERTALDAGVTWVEKDLFSGKPDF